MSVDFLKMNTLDKAVESYLEVVEDADANRLRFFKGLWDIQDELTAGAAQYAAPSKDEANDAARAKEPIFVRYPVAVDRDVYLDAISRIARYVGESAGLAEAQVSALAGADFGAAVTEENLAKAPHDVEGFLAETFALLQGEGEEGEPATELEPAVFAMVAVAALTPLIAGAAIDARAAIDSRTISETGPQECPVCGSAASMSVVGERSTLQGGDRKLWCGLCHTTWPYARVRCARCGTRSSTALRYTHTEEDPGHRIHLCEECHGYIRVVFLDEVRHIHSPAVEDVVTTPLHAVAAQLGYTSAGDGVKRDVAQGVEYPEGVDLGGAF